jgi:hypothetical protein
VKFEKLECIVLAHDIAEHGLKTGDLGTIVEIYPVGEVEVEFTTGSGVTQALLTLTKSDIRKIDSLDLPATRRLARVK